MSPEPIVVHMDNAMLEQVDHYIYLGANGQRKLRCRYNEKNKPQISRFWQVKLHSERSERPDKPKMKSFTFGHTWL